MPWHLLTTRGWYLPLIGLAVILLYTGVLRSLAGLMPYLIVLMIVIILSWTFLGTRSAVAAGPDERRSTAAALNTSVSNDRIRFGKKLDVQDFADRLKEGPPIGAPSWLARHVSLTLHAFLVSAVPKRPWSLLVVADETWCLDEFALRFGKALSPKTQSTPARLECTATMEFNREQIAKAITASGVPLLIINATEHLRAHPNAAAIAATLQAILQGRDPLLKEAAILLLEKGRPVGIHVQADLAAELREHRDAMKAVSAIPVGDVTTTAVLLPLTNQADRLTILWEEFCRYAAAEYGVKIENAESLEASSEDSMWDFLGTVLDEWDQHGMPEAQRFMRLISEAALTRARLADVRSARASWEPASQRIRLKTSGEA